MAIRLKPMEKIAIKYVANAGAATGSYKDGVDAPKTDQAQAAIAAKDNFAAGVQEAIAQDRFAKGVERAGSAKWARKAKEVGAGRYAQGVTAAKDDFTKGTQPFLSAIASLDLPARQPKGSPANYARVQAVGEALRKVKLGL